MWGEVGVRVEVSWWRWAQRRAISVWREGLLRRVVPKDMTGMNVSGDV